MPDEDADPRLAVAQRRRQRDADERRQRASQAEQPHGEGAAEIVRVHEQGDDQGPLRGDRQGPGDLETAQVRVQQDPMDGGQ